MAEHLLAVTPDNVRVEPVALSDRDGDASLFVHQRPGLDALGTLEEKNSAEGSERVGVELRRLDDYHIEDVGFVKVDVESHEGKMIRGARETLLRCRPVLLIEVEQRMQEEPIEEVFQLICSMGYDGWIRRDRGWAALDTFDVRRDQLEHLHEMKSVRYINNFVFTPSGSGPPSPRSV